MGWPGYRAMLARKLMTLVLATLMTGCSSALKPIDHEQDSGGTPVAGSFLLEQSQKHLNADNGQSAFALLDSGRDAFLVRAALVEAASERIDAQYYIWNNDATGRYLAGRLLAAADRGVTVRLLLDDINVAGEDSLFAAMDTHPNIEVRIYNPVRARSGVGRLFSLAANFDRINRRMHNKSFVVDGHVGITGGRNIGDEYFDEDPQKNARDRDVMVLGPLVDDMSDSFLAYWGDAWAYPVNRLYQGTEAEFTKILDRLNEETSGPLSLHADPPRERPAAQNLLETWFAGMTQAPGELVFDPPPEDPEAPADTPKPTAKALYRLVDSAQSEILIESAYLILSDKQLTEAVGFSNPDISVRALTNSLTTNDLLTNHSGYARWRREMLEHGMELYELRPDSPACRRWVAEDIACQRGGVTLHSKAVVFDRETLFIGSFNVNLRSIYLNGETILIIHSPEMAQTVADDIRYAMAPENSWQVSLDENGELIWQAGEESFDHEPQVGLWTRMKSRFLSWLPIAKYL